MTDPTIASGTLDQDRLSSTHEIRQAEDDSRTDRLSDPLARNAARSRNSESVGSVSENEQRQSSQERGRSERGEGRAAPTGPVVEDQTLIELRHDLSAGLDTDDFGI